MPPKKAKDDGKGPGKMSKKEKKLWDKFGTVMIEGLDGKETSVVALRRDELEWAVERLRDQMTTNRSERIRYQLERDFLFELQEQYRKKLDCLTLEQETLTAENTKASQDAEEGKIIKGMEGKHFRAETQIMATQQECRNELRRKKIKELLERSFHYMSLDMDEQDDILDRNAAVYTKRIQDTQKKLQDLHKYMDDHEQQLEQFVQNLEKEKQNSTVLFFVIRRMENQMTEERWNEFIWKLSQNFENSLKAMKKFYNDASFSNFTMIHTLQDMITSSVERMDQYRNKIKELQAMMRDAHSQMPGLRIQFSMARVRHDRIVRTKAGINTVSKELQLNQNKTNALRMDYRTNFVRLENINLERENFRSNGAEMVQNMLDAYSHRFRVAEDEATTQTVVERRDAEKNKLLSNFQNPEQFQATITPFKSSVMQKNGLVEDYHLMSIKLRKQSENLRNSMDSRLRRVGLTRKHPTFGPKGASAFGSVSGGRGGVRFGGKPNWGPANLVAGTSFPARNSAPTAVMEGDEGIRTAVPVCLTPSIQNFLSFKKTQRDQKEMQKKRVLEAQRRLGGREKYCY